MICRSLIAAVLATILIAFSPCCLSAKSASNHINPIAGETPAQISQRMRWWREARFGMFIHWDMSSIQGTEISWSRKGSKPLDVYNEPAGYVEDPVYDHLYERFNPTKFDAKEWVKLAQAAGMKYIIFTAKHHGGFCMWDTKLTDYSIMHTPFHRDVVKELADACHAAGMRFGLYYSPRDWHNPDYGIGDNRKYVDYMNGQLRELLTNYGKIDVLWFDGYGHGDVVNFWRVGETYNLIKSLQPDIIINNRLAVLDNGEQPAPYQGDFDTPEQRIGAYQVSRPWESCMSLVTTSDGGGWSYRPDGTVKTLSECIRGLVNCAGGGGNLLLDVGPNSAGEIPSDQAGRLLEIGAWMKANGASIYGTTAGPNRRLPFAGRMTVKGDTLYLNVFEWPEAGLTLSSLHTRVRGAKVLATGQKLAVQQDQDGTVTISKPDHLDPVSTAIALNLTGVPVMDQFNVVSPAANGDIVLAAADATLSGSEIRCEGSDDPDIGYWTSEQDTASWKVRASAARVYQAKVEYSCAPGNEGSTFALQMDGAQLATGTVPKTGSWGDYAPLTLDGTITIPPGLHELKIVPLKKANGALMNLRTLTLTPVQ